MGLALAAGRDQCFSARSVDMMGLDRGGGFAREERSEVIEGHQRFAAISLDEKLPMSGVQRNRNLAGGHSRRNQSEGGIAVQRHAPADRKPVCGGEPDANPGEAARPAIDQQLARPRPPSSSLIMGTNRSAWPRPTTSWHSPITSSPSISAAEQAAVALSITSSIAAFPFPHRFTDPPAPWPRLAVQKAPGDRNAHPAWRAGQQDQTLRRPRLPARNV
jgi:hypothetical protein